MSIHSTPGLQPSGGDLVGVISSHEGPRLVTPRGGVVHCVRPPGTFAFRSAGDSVVVLLAPVQGLESCSPDGETLALDAPTGALSIVPANVERSGRWASSVESLTVGFEAGQLAALAEQEFGVTGLRLTSPGFGSVDEQALRIALLLRQELAGSRPNALYADSLITALGIHVIRHYSNAGGKAKMLKPGGGLSPAAAERVREFLNLNVAGKVTIAELALLCDLSPSHFIESFAKTFGAPPHRYLLNLRLNLAAQLLSQTALPIAEIAYLSGFSSQSHLTSAMRKYRLTTPAQVRSRTKS